MSAPTSYRKSAGFGKPDEVIDIPPPRASAQRLYVATQALREAEEALERAKGRVQNYTGQWNEIDFYGDEQIAFNRALDAFEAALAQSVIEYQKRYG